MIGILGIAIAADIGADALVLACILVAVIFTPIHIYLALKHGWGYGRSFKRNS